MPARLVDRYELRRLAEAGAQLVEVLPREEYEDNDAGQSVCVVVDDERVVTGLLRRRTAEAHAGATVAEVMRPGPATVRAHEPLGPLLERMAKARVETLWSPTRKGGCWAWWIAHPMSKSSRKATSSPEYCCAP